MLPNVATEHERQYNKWSDWVKQLRTQVHDLYFHRAIWQEMHHQLDTRSTHETTFSDHYSQLYVHHQASTIRRLVDSDTDVVSLTRLLGEVLHHPEIMTRERHLANWQTPAGEGAPDSSLERRGNEVFDRFADTADQNVSSDRIAEDLAEWKLRCAPIKRFVNKVIAHSVELREEQIPFATYKDLDDTVDTVGNLIMKYTQLFFGGPGGRLGGNMTQDWKQPFRAALFPE